jgi:hypothetical protein
MITIKMPTGGVKVAGEGVLLDSSVWFRYVTQEDGRVRPEHRALHGKIFRFDDPNAPIPPLDYGCRCGIEYVAQPGSAAAEILPEADKPPEGEAPPDPTETPKPRPDPDAGPTLSELVLTEETAKRKKPRP